jgi:hypothetical protein
MYVVSLAAFECCQESSQRVFYEIDLFQIVLDSERNNAVWSVLLLLLWLRQSEDTLARREVGFE